MDLDEFCILFQFNPTFLIKGPLSSEARINLYQVRHKLQQYFDLLSGREMWIRNMPTFPSQTQTDL